MRKSNWMPLGFILCLLCLTYGVGCSGGTITGNPNQTTNGKITSVDSLIFAICSKLISCHAELEFVFCQQSVNLVSNIDSEIGLTPGQFADLAEVREAELEEIVMGDEEPTDQCVDEIQALSCSDQIVEDAYDPEDLGNFDSVYLLLSSTSGSCPDIF